MSQLIALVFKLIVHQSHSEKVILKVYFEENVSSEGCAPLYSVINFIFIINICKT